MGDQIVDTSVILMRKILEGNLFSSRGQNILDKDQVLGLLCCDVSLSFNSIDRKRELNPLIPKGNHFEKLIESSNNRENKYSDEETCDRSSMLQASKIYPGLLYPLYAQDLNFFLIFAISLAPSFITAKYYAQIICIGRLGQILAEVGDVGDRDRISENWLPFCRFSIMALSLIDEDLDSQCSDFMNLESVLSLLDLKTIDYWVDGMEELECFSQWRVDFDQQFYTFSSDQEGREESGENQVSFELRQAVKDQSSHIMEESAQSSNQQEVVSNNPLQGLSLDEQMILMSLIQGTPNENEDALQVKSMS